MPTISPLARRCYFLILEGDVHLARREAAGATFTAAERRLLVRTARNRWGCQW